MTIDKVLIPWFNKNNNKIENLSLQEINFKITKPNQIKLIKQIKNEKEIQLLESVKPEKSG